MFDTSAFGLDTDGRRITGAVRFAKRVPTSNEYDGFFVVMTLQP